MAKTNFEADILALNQFANECEDLPKLEALLSKFNLFRVLRFEYAELRHSNILAWLLDPNESHGLGSGFLKNWLTILANKDVSFPVSIDEIGRWNLKKVEIRREWNHIDLLVVLTMQDGSRWIICIENKVQSQQHSGQLERYRSHVQNEFCDKDRKIYLFLTKNPEIPKDMAYLPTSYDQVYQALKSAMVSQRESIKSEPKVLLGNYLSLLEEKFMNQSEVARVALQIYQKHRQAIDVIMRHQPEKIREMVREKVEKVLREQAAELGILIENFTDKIIRFTPKSWDVPGNRNYQNFKGNGRHLLCELKLLPDETTLCVVSGKSPKPWIDGLFEMAQKPPFFEPGKWDHPGWLWLHWADNTSISFSDEALGDPTEMAEAIISWVRDVLAQPDTKQVFVIIAAKLQMLPSK